jgi:hypothetical protein
MCDSDIFTIWRDTHSNGWEHLNGGFIGKEYYKIESIKLEQETHIRQ